MQIQTWQLFFVLILFIFGIGLLTVFIYRFKFTKIQRVAKIIGWKSYLGEANIPAEYKIYGANIRRFAWFEWILEGDVNGKKVFFAQYFLSGATQYPYRYVAFSFFDENISVLDVDREYGPHFKDIFQNSSDFALSQDAVFFYRSIPWEMNQKNILSVAEKLSQVRNLVDKK
jgi:hypothetical protein